MPEDVGRKPWATAGSTGLCMAVVPDLLTEKVLVLSTIIWDSFFLIIIAMMYASHFLIRAAGNTQEGA